MNERTKGVLTGAIATFLVLGIGTSALAATGLLTIDVDPNVNIMVNGEVFKPKNEQGEGVLLFNYGGTVYAPVRALAEAYGLEVNWDPNANMASVAEPTAPAEPTTPPDTTATLPVDYSDWSAEEEAAYQEFKAMWEVTKVPDENMKMFSDPASWCGMEVHPCETNLYNIDTNKDADVDQDMIFLYGERWLEEYYVPGKNTLFSFSWKSDLVQNGSSWRGCKIMRTANGEIGYEKYD